MIEAGVADVGVTLVGSEFCRSKSNAEKSFS